jgi:nucleotide-binding universal stress UspA family protein
MSDAGHKNEHFIVVGVDGSEPSLDALRWAARQSRLTGATLRVLTTWEVSVGTGWAATFPVDYDPEAIAKQVLDAAISSVLGPSPDIAVERTVEEGHAGPVLLAAASGADLLVVGSHGHGAIAGVLLGSVSEHLVRHAPCAIVVVHCAKAADHSVPVDSV